MPVDTATRYYRNCYSSSSRYTYRYYAQMRYMPWHRYTFTSSNALPSGATVDAIKLEVLPPTTAPVLPRHP